MKNTKSITKSETKATRVSPRLQKLQKSQSGSKDIQKKLLLPSVSVNQIQAANAANTRNVEQVLFQEALSSRKSTASNAFCKFFLMSAQCRLLIIL